MLANIEPAHNDFHALASYLVHGRERPTHPGRVAWLMAHNLPSDDPLRAAKIMTATAELSRRCRNACYHMSINWHPDEQPTPAIMQEITKRTLDLAGLGEHQALVIGHGDKPHAHCHLMINRVHPVTGRAWSTSHDWRRFDRIMKELAGGYGFRYVPPHSFEPELTDALPKAPSSPAIWAARRGAPTHRPQWSAVASRRYGARLSELLDRGSSPDDVVALLAEDGLAIEAKGSGHVVGNPVSYTKLSRLGLTMTVHGLARLVRANASKPRRTPPRAKVQAWAARRSVLAVDTVDILRVLGTRAQLRAAIQHAAAARKARLAEKPLMVQLMEELKQQLKASTALTRAGRRRARRPKAQAKPRNRGR